MRAKKFGHMLVIIVLSLLVVYRYFVCALWCVVFGVSFVSGEFGLSVLLCLARMDFGRSSFIDGVALPV